MDNNENINNLKLLINKLEELKKLGNEEFLKYDKSNDDLNKRAVTYYSIAIELFNEKFGTLKENESEDTIKEVYKLLSIIYSNLALCYLNGYAVDKALECSTNGIKYDKDNSKCYYRQALSYQHLCNYKEALKSIESGLAATTANDKSLKQLMTNEKREIQLKIIKRNKEEKDCKDRIKRDFDQFNQFPVELVWSDQFGRRVLASEDLPKGSMLLRVSPFGSCLEDDKIFKNCGFCYKKIEKSKRDQCKCKICNNFLLCERCSTTDPFASEYHKEECDILQFLKEYYPSTETKDFRFMFRVVLNALKEKKFQSFKKENCSSNWKKHEHPFIFDEYQDLENLSRTLDKVDPQQMEAFKRSASSIIAVISKLRGEDAILKYITLNEIIELYSIVLSNGHEMLHPLTCRSYGMGIFPTGSYLNHSCSPNAFWYNDEQGMMVFRSLRPLKKGEELLTSYTDVTNPLEDRRKYLMKQYFFFCQCNQCQYQSNLVTPNCTTCKENLTIDKNFKFQIPQNSNESGFIYKCSKGHITKDQGANNNPDQDYDDEDDNKKYDYKTFKYIEKYSKLIENRFKIKCGEMKIPKNLSINQQYQLTRMPDHVIYRLYLDELERCLQGNPCNLKSDQMLTNNLIQYYYKLFCSLKKERPTDTKQIQDCRKKILDLLYPIINLPTSHHKISIENKLK
ncbi:hypothetical protein DICPUDRAFT_89992 [Dictyostelium purpureum]|uniref:SET domain-containing protein n=1 Tax=Dictyostelium purpureum TaxID=5786 RepID=F0ZZL6_DICPU|nr:uncharacterized protein DICPUDRAFT_89992 [Dictyostelium purpureum]EGC30616.1 hypothetical protein DICPUDRAFT_89992 [Dictyostelium purpureum]|eukprot:XP_003292851.1 hypothetical protein DICPUDRAFT_89992 [Dictyostelium purpureum]